MAVSYERGTPVHLVIHGNANELFVHPILEFERRALKAAAVERTRHTLSLRPTDLLGPVTIVKKKKKKTQDIQGRILALAFR